MRAADIYTVAGNGDYSGDGGPAVKAGLSPGPATAQPGCGPTQNRAICAAGVSSSGPTPRAQSRRSGALAE